MRSAHSVLRGTPISFNANSAPLAMNPTRKYGTHKRHRLMPAARRAAIPACFSAEEEARLAVLGCHVLLEPGEGPALVFDIGGKNDKSFGEAAWRGAEAWKKETGKPYLEFEIANAAQRDGARHIGHDAHGARDAADQQQDGAQQHAHGLCRNAQIG